MASAVQDPKTDQQSQCSHCHETAVPSGHGRHAHHAAAPHPPLDPSQPVQWTCPMHPEIVRDAPGSCPICGMALEPRTITAEETENPELRDMTRRFWVAVALTVPLLVLAMGRELAGGWAERLLSPGASAWIELLLATPVVLW